MEPLSIANATISLAAAITKAGYDIVRFSNSVREAQQSMKAVQSELSALSTCLTALEEISTAHENIIPRSLAQNVLAIIKDCESLVTEISALLQKMGTGSVVRKSQWALFGEADAARLRGHLEAHKSALSIALETVNHEITRRTFLEVTKNRAQGRHIKQDTVSIRAQNAQILEEIQELRQRLERLGMKDTVMRRFLESATQSVVGSEEDLEERKNYDCKHWVGSPPSESESYSNKPEEVLKPSPPTTLVQYPKAMACIRIGELTRSKMGDGKRKKLDALLIKKVCKKDCPPSVIEEILSKGAHIESTGWLPYVSGFGTPLIILALLNNVEGLNFVLDCGANIDAATNHHQKNALWCAARIGNAQIVRALITRGADTTLGPSLPVYQTKHNESDECLRVFIDLRRPGEYWNRILDDLQQEREFADLVIEHPELVEFSERATAFKHGSFSAAKKEKTFDLLRKLSRRAELWNADPSVLTMETLPVAASHGNLKAVEFLIEQPNDRTKIAWEKLLISAIQSQKEEIIEWILGFYNHRMVINARYIKPPDPTMSALGVAAQCGNERIFTLLVDKGCNINDFCGPCGTPLQTAICSTKCKGKARLARAMINLGAEIDSPRHGYDHSGTGKTQTRRPRHNSHSEDPSNHSRRLEYNFHCTFWGNDLLTCHPSPLETAIATKDLEVTELLLENGACINYIPWKKSEFIALTDAALSKADRHHYHKKAERSWDHDQLGWAWLDGWDDRRAGQEILECLKSYGYHGEDDWIRLYVRDTKNWKQGLRKLLIG